MAAVWAEEDWILHTPGGGPLDSRCPCLTTELCPRVFGDSELDARHFGHIPICMDSRQVRCCGASFSTEVSGVPGILAGSRHEHGAPGQREAGANNTNTVRVETKSTQISQTGPANNLQATSNGEVSVAGHQQKGTDELEGYKDNTSTTAENNYLNVSPKVTASHESSQQTEAPQKGSNTHHSDLITVFPWDMAVKFDTTEPEVTLLVYNSNSDGNDTNDWDSDMNDYSSPINDTAEMHLFESENEKNDHLMGTTTAFDTEAYKREKEYLVASSRENKGITEDIEMQQDSEDDRNDDAKEHEEGKGGDIDGEQYIVDESESVVPEHALINGIQNKGQNIPKRSFVSENLKMRISQLATGEQTRRPGADGRQDRHRKDPPSDPKTEVERQAAYRKESATNRPRKPAVPPAKTIIRSPRTQSQRYENLPGLSVGRKTARSQLLQDFRSKAKHLTRNGQERTTTLHALQNKLSGQVDTNYTLGSGAEKDTSQSHRSGLKHVPAAYQTQEGGPEMTLSRDLQIHLKRHSEIVAELANGGRRNTNTDLFTTGGNRTAEKTEMLATKTKSTRMDEFKTSEAVLKGAVEHSRRPVVIKRATGASRGTFGLRTRTRDRSFASQSRAAGGRDSRATTSSQNQQEVAEVSSQSAGVATRRGVALASSLETDASGSAHEDISAGRPGLINIIGPIPKGFTDPVTTQNVHSATQGGPLFQLPYNTQPEPFRTAIPRPTMPLIVKPVTLSESARPPSSAAASSSYDVNVRRQPDTQTAAAMARQPNTSSVSSHERHLQPQNHIVSDFSASQVQLYLTAPTHEVVEFRQSPLTQPAAATPPHSPAALLHSSHDDLAVRAKIVPLPQMTSVQKFLSFPDQQLRQPGKQQESVGSQQSSKHPAGSRPTPHLFAVYQQDAVRHAAQMEYTNKLQEYFQQLLSYSEQQQHVP